MAYTEQMYRRLYRIVVAEKGYCKLKKFTQPTKISLSNHMEYLLRNTQKLFVGSYVRQVPITHGIRA